MKFICSSARLLKQLQALSGVINSNNTLQSLDDFLFSLEGDILTITASDLETTMSVNIKPDMVDGNGKATIPSKMFLEIMKSFADVPVTVKIDEKTFGVEITAGDGNYKMSGHVSDEYPKTPVIEDAQKFSVPADVLASGFEKTIFATGNDEIRPIMNGVLMEMSPEHLTFVATDAHKLVRYRRSDVKSDTTSSFIVPKKPVNQLKNILGTLADQEVIIEFDLKNARFTFGDYTLICRLIEGRYPNYEAVIPVNNPNQLVVDRQLFLSAIHRVSIFSSKATHLVRFKVVGQQLVMTAEDIDFYNEAKECLTCSYTGSDMEIGFNSRFFQEMLSNLNTNEVRLEMSAPNRAGIITPVNSSNEDEDVLMLIMPVMLNQ